EDALKMTAKLYELNHPVRLLFLEGAQHNLSEQRETVWYTIRSFFDHYVKNTQPLPEMKPHGN
ncbi:MAG: hypothetical protein KDD04_12225, partial [Sinomicrobium sp.]|nr:hypothetical protein [Sinomicrobium sp.]